MRPLTIAIVLIAAAPAAGLSPRDRIPVATPAGQPVDCIPLTSIRETRVRDDRTIDFVTLGNSGAYRVTLPQACPQLGRLCL